MQGRRLRSDHRRDLGHWPGRRGDRAAGGYVAVRDDAGVRRRVSNSRKSTCWTLPTSSPSTSSIARAPQDALRDVRKQYQRNRELFRQAPETLPVYGTMASRFNDDGVTALYQALGGEAAEKGLKLKAGTLPPVTTRQSTAQHAIMPAARVRYLAEIAETVRQVSRVDGSARRALRASGSSCMEPRRCLPPNASWGREGTRRACRRPRHEARSAREKAARHVAADQGGLLGRRIRREDPRQGNPQRADDHVAVGHARAEGRVAAIPG